MTRAEVIRIAIRAAEVQGIDLSSYKAPEIHSEPTGKKTSWLILFDHPIPMPGGLFTISVDDETGETRFFPGL